MYIVCIISSRMLFCETISLHHFNIIGAFGVVHKGEMIASDGIAKAVAIKTIKCMFCCYVCIDMFILAQRPTL